MSEKYFTIAEEGTNKQFKLMISYNSTTINFEMQSKDNPKEKYELRNLPLSYFHQIKQYQQFTTIKQIVDVISGKLEKKNFLLRTGCVLNIKFTSVQDDVFYVPFVIKSIGSSPSGSSSNSDAQLRAENERLRRENLDLRAQLEKLSSTKSTPSYNNSYAPPKTNSYVPPPSKAPTAPKPTPPPVTKPKPVSNTPSYGNKSTTPQIQIVGNYVPPSMNKSGNIFDRINQTIALKNNMQKTLDEIYNRLNDAKRRIDNFVDKAFANNPTVEDKKKALNLITEVLLLRQGFKDIHNYQEIFQNEVKEKGIHFSPADQEKFDDSIDAVDFITPFAFTIEEDTSSSNELTMKTSYDSRYFSLKKVVEVSKESPVYSLVNRYLSETYTLKLLNSGDQSPESMQLEDIADYLTSASFKQLMQPQSQAPVSPTNNKSDKDHDDR